MKRHAQVGNQAGRPTYRTAADFRFRKFKSVQTRKINILAGSFKKNRGAK